MTAPLTTTEAAAHLTIVTALDRALAEDWHWVITQGATQVPLEQFRSRCNCRRVLHWSPRVDGLRVASCLCGARIREVT